MNDYIEQFAAELDPVADLPENVLWRIVVRDGACMAIYAEGQAPPFTGNESTDRELAAQVCAGCPVRAECLELEFRTAGPDGLGVWGALNEDDRRAVYPVWLARRSGGEQG
ncbi:WhiB family transcriptional regulator [Actinokineospora spheciospongiae]|uniref:WhiB family transcriptional regulator n=1 Tax=Actinokineospora spheciospongiae TaxID=909613 RepID=UPI00054F0CBC|nr:WhiB family transcriptional regulator [Actinokineospora spheciospongiae]